MPDEQSNPLDEARGKQGKPFDEAQGRQNQWPDKGQSQSPPPLGTGEGEVPLAKPLEPAAPPKGPDVDMRTSASDVESIQKEGGGAPKPYIPPPVPSEKPPEVPGVGVPKEPEKEQVFQPPQVEPSPVPGKLPEFKEVSAKKSKKGLFLGLLAVIVVIGLAVVGYFFVYPFFFQAPEEVAEAPAEPAPSAPVEVPSVPEVPSAFEVPEVLEGEQVIEETPPPAELPELPAITEHVTFFKTKADISTDVTLAALNMTVLRDTFEFTTAEVPLLKEMVLKDSQGEFVSFGGLLGALLPQIVTSDVALSFEPDFTMFIYSDSNGSWPGYIVKLRSGAVLSDAQAKISVLEGSANLANLFLASPGSPTTWKNGQAEGISNRYLTYSQSGAGLNYGWLNDTLVIGTSYSGFQEALKRLK